jgi:hypothetical protein
VQALSLFIVTLTRKFAQQATSDIIGCYAQPSSGKYLTLDSQDRAPSSKFNVVDASELADLVGLLNLLISVIPIFELSLTSILHTDVVPRERPRVV